MSIQQEDILYGKLCIAGMPVVQGEIYQGSYIVTPKVTSQSLDTDNKFMEQDVSILAIPYYEVSNISGKTAIIGEI